MSRLTFAEVVECVLNENQHRTESSLNDLQGHCSQIWEELDDLTEARRDETNSSSWRKIKREIDLRWKDLESLRAAISHRKSSLGQGQQEDITTGDDDLANPCAKVEMATAPDSPSGSTMTQSSDLPPAKGPAPAMEVDDRDNATSPASPVSPADDDLLTGGGALGVEGELANLKVSSPKDLDSGGGDASI